MMQCFGITVKAKDNNGLHYVNHTVLAASLDAADAIVLDYYASCNDEFIEFDQAILLNNVHFDGSSRIIETQGKIYFSE
jgi:hypothetical protein